MDGEGGGQGYVLALRFGKPPKTLERKDAIALKLLCPMHSGCSTGPTLAYERTEYTVIPALGESGIPAFL